MTLWFGGVGAVRIQTWILRTPKFTHLRGASIALHEHTRYEVVEEWRTTRPDLAEVSILAPESSIDGVVALRAPSEADAALAVSLITQQVSAQLPGLQWEGWWCPAESYLSAFHANVSDSAGVRRLVSLPPLQDNGLVASCSLCRSEPAGLPVVSQRGDSTKMLPGADCRARGAAWDRERQSRNHAPTGVADDGGREIDIPGWDIPGADWPDDFTQLAHRGGLPDTGHRSDGGTIGRTDSRNHLATITADGNGIGGLFAVIAHHTPPQSTLHANAVLALNDAMKRAVVVASKQIGDPQTPRRATLPHFVGGDDASLSVPAPYAWEYAVALATEFGELRATYRTLLGADADIGSDARETIDRELERVSLGVGIVFAHASHPVADTYDAAHAALGRAKAVGGGRSACLAWQDLTSDAGGTSYVLALAAAQRQLPLPPGDPLAPDAFGISPSGRAQLAGILRDTPATSQKAAVGNWAKRTGNFLGDYTPFDTDVLRLLAADLSRARWWPSTLQEEAR